MTIKKVLVSKGGYINISFAIPNTANTVLFIYAYGDVANLESNPSYFSDVASILSSHCFSHSVCTLFGFSQCSGDAVLITQCSPLCNDKVTVQEAGGEEHKLSLRVLGVLGFSACSALSLSITTAPAPRKWWPFSTTFVNAFAQVPLNWSSQNTHFPPLTLYSV